jgi:hypothetical protein
MKTETNTVAILWPGSEEVEKFETPLSFEDFINEKFGSAYSAFLERGGEAALIPSARQDA